MLIYVLSYCIELCKSKFVFCFIDSNQKFLFTFSSYFFMNKRCFLKPSLLQFYLSIYQFSLPTILCRRSLGRAHSFQYNHENSTSMDIPLGISLPIIDEFFFWITPNEDFHSAKNVIYTYYIMEVSIDGEGTHFHLFNIRNLSNFGNQPIFWRC